MIISHKHKFVFIEVPKTGTSSIRNALKEKLNIKDIYEIENEKDLHTTDFMCGLKFGYDNHITLSKILDRHPYTKDYFKFAFVRNPWDSQVSKYHYYKNGGIYKRLIGEQIAEQSLSERELMLHKKSIEHNLFDWSLIYENPMVQYNYLSVNKIIKTDFIGRFENIQEDFNKICDKILIDRITIPHRNKSDHSHYSKYYDDESKQYVAEVCKQDILEFGYYYDK